MIAFRLQAYDRLASTSDEIQRLAGQGAPHGTAVIAGQQTQGRGRQGRTWLSPPGNLHLSLLLRPAIPARRAAEIGLLAALAVADAVERHCPEGSRAGLKWPNDVRVSGAKIAGILLESELSGAAIAWMAVGIGVNVAHHPADTPNPATSLHAQGGTPATPDQVAAAVLDAFARWWVTWSDRGFRAVLDAWHARADLLGEIIHVRQGDGVVTGRFEGLDADGTLLLAMASGLHRITTGEISFGPG